MSLTGSIGQIKPSNVVRKVEWVVPNVTLTCTSYGETLWFYGSLEILNAHDYDYLESTLYRTLIAKVRKIPIGKHNTLILNRLASDNSGFYFCYGSLRNRSGFSIAMAVLKVYGKSNSLLVIQ